MFLDRSGNPLPLYRTKLIKIHGGGGSDEFGVNPNEGLIGKYYSNNSDDNPVCTFDVDEETIRHEPWTGSPTDYKANIDAFYMVINFIFLTEVECFMIIKENC